jgi:hypothetical protein
MEPAADLPPGDTGAPRVSAGRPVGHQENIGVGGDPWPGERVPRHGD